MEEENEVVISHNERKSGNGTLIVLLCVFVFFIGCGAMYGFIGAFPNLFTNNVTKLEKNVTVNENGIADAVEKVYDAVVVVSTYRNNTLYASGTGFVYRKDDKSAYILTNNHVIENGSKVTVTFTNGNVVETEIIGNDALSDIAVLSVDKEEAIDIAEIGTSTDLRVGDTTFAVGAPLNSVYSWSVTRGIISGKDRMVEVSTEKSGDYVMKVLQTDAAINEGNSGGPLCNSNGEIIGITSLKLVDESVEGMGFAIPIEVALSYAEKLVNGEKITQPYMGVSMINVTQAYYSQYYRMLVASDITKGVIVVRVEDGSPASKAGLQEADVITKINDDEVASVGYLRYYLYNYEIGDKITITYIRDGKEKTTVLTLESSDKTY